MFRSLDHPQGATFFLAKVILKTFTNQFLYVICFILGNSPASEI